MPFQKNRARVVSFLSLHHQVTMRRLTALVDHVSPVYGKEYQKMMQQSLENLAGLMKEKDVPVEM